MLTKSQFVQELNEMDTHVPGWRWGQCAFNLMYRSFPEVANKYRGGDLDPYYHDDRVEAFIDKCFEEIEA